MQTQPPPAMPKDKQPFAKMLMPAIMVVAVIGMIAAMVLTGAGRSPMTFIFPLMMLGSMAMMFSPGTNVDEVRRSFHRHIDAVVDGLQRKRREQLSDMEAELPHPSSLWTHIRSGAEVTAAPGIVRVGTAVQAPRDALEIPVNDPPEDLEPVSAMSLREVAIRYATIEAPVSIDIAGFHCVVVVGDGAAGLVRAMQAQLVMQDPAALRILGPHQEWLPHDGPRTIRFVDGSYPVTSGCIVTQPNEQWVQAASGQGLYLKADGDDAGRVLSAWTVDGWVPFGVADSLSEVELAMVCRSRSQLRTSTSLLELEGGDLRAPIGFAGAPVYLDIKESAMGGIGPHGLCIGATGSGKSELLKSIVVSFAHNHSPQELNFILVDFKGGATFLGLERLPHTSAVITNLADEAGLVERMRDSLLGEMHRRQERLRAAGLTTAWEFNRDYPGQMPALFIIVDEFSELLSARPEFAEVFAAIGRLGRSLRMHLLLASQRLEEGRLRGLESHLSYRIALRTFSAAESRALIGSTEAYELPSTPGAAILSAGVQQRFQSAYVSGPEVPQDQRLVRPLGATVDSTATTLEVVVEALAGPNQNPVWLPPLPQHLQAASVMHRTQTPGVAWIGLEDKPFEGEQVPYAVDIRRKHWIVVGQPRSGKTQALKAIIAGLCLSTPGLTVYVCDPGGSLQTLQRLPQVAAVVGVQDLPRLLDEVELTTGPRLLVMDGVDQLGDEEQRFIRLATTGLEQQLHVVVTSLRWNLRPSLRDVLTGHIELKMSSLDSVYRDAQKALPDIAGRGVGHHGKHIQCCLIGGEDISHIQQVSLERGEEERSMRMLPSSITFDELVTLEPDAAQTGAFAIGGPRLAGVHWDWERFPHLVVVGQSGAGATTALRSVIHGLQRQQQWKQQHSHPDGQEMEILMTDTRRGLLGLPGYEVATLFRERLEQVCEELRARIPSADISPEQLALKNWWCGPEYFIVVDDADVDPGLDALVDLLPYAGDIGLHVVVARRSGQFARQMYQPLMQAIRDQSAWLLLSAPREDGPIAGQRLSLSAPGRGVFVQKEPWAVQVVRGGEVTGSADASGERQEAMEGEARENA